MASLGTQWREEHAHDFWSGLSAALQPGVESDRASLETDSRRCLHNRYFSDLDKVIDAVEATSIHGSFARNLRSDYAQLLKRCV